MTTKLQNQIKGKTDKEICESEMNIDINRFIKELKSLNMKAYYLKAVLGLLNEQSTKSRI